MPGRKGRWLGVVAQRQETKKGLPGYGCCGEGCVVSGGANLFGRARRECTGRVWRTLKLRCIIGGRGGKARARDIIQYPPQSSTSHHFFWCHTLVQYASREPILNLENTHRSRINNLVNLCACTYSYGGSGEKLRTYAHAHMHLHAHALFMHIAHMHMSVRLVPFHA